MILSDSVRIKMVNSVINKYRNLGYVCKLNEVIPIKIEHLPFNSHAEINVLCKICKTEKCISYRHYIKCTECKSRDYLCKKCSIIRKNKTNLKKYGVENVFSNLDIKNKIKNTLIKKYNVDNPSKSENIKNKIKHTNIEKYGHCCALHGEKQKRKTKETNLKKYGDEIYFKTEDKKIKSIITNNKKIGVDYPTQSANVREKIKKTNFKKFGVENPSQSLEIFNKARTSGLRVKKYGNNNIDNSLAFDFERQNNYCEFICKIPSTNNIKSFSSGDYIRFQFYLLTITDIFGYYNNTNGTQYFEFILGNLKTEDPSIRNYFQVKDLDNPDTRYYYTSSYIQTDPFFIQSGSNCLSFSSSSLYLFDTGSTFISENSYVSKHYSEVIDNFGVQKYDLFRFGKFENPYPVYYEVKDVKRFGNTNAIYLDRPIAPYITGSLLSSDFAILRPKPDETSVIINHKKAPGEVSTTLLIPGDLSTRVKDQVGNIFQSIKSNL